MVSFNCGQTGHLYFACNGPKVCFICQSTEHVVDLYPEWKKPAHTAGLGFQYIDVEETKVQTSGRDGQLWGSYH